MSKVSFSKTKISFDEYGGQWMNWGKHCIFYFKEMSIHVTPYLRELSRVASFPCITKHHVQNAITLSNVPGHTLEMED